MSEATRLAALEAVVEAAREWSKAYQHNVASWSHVKDVNAALAALALYREAGR